MGIIDNVGDSLFGRRRPKTFTYNLDIYDVLKDLKIKGRLKFCKYNYKSKKLQISVEE